MDEPNSGDASIWPRSYHGLYSTCRGGHHRTYREWTWDSLKNTQRDWTNIHQRFNRLTVFSDHNRKIFLTFHDHAPLLIQVVDPRLWRRNYRNISASVENDLFLWFSWWHALSESYIMSSHSIIQIKIMVFNTDQWQN